jgi:glutaminyl-peptide cyclotransferase
MKHLPAIAVLFILLSCNGDNRNNGSGTEDNNNGSTGIPAPAILQASVMAEYPHDTAAYTEGLQFHNGKLYEGTGLVKQSMIKVVDIKTGNADKKQLIADPAIFGEGINVFKDKLYQLTYQNHVVFVYNLSDLSKPVKTFPWASEGWGMTNNGTELIISDGQAQGNLYFVNPDDFRIKRIVQVVDNIGTVDNINELEYIDGYVYANVYGDTYIIKIDPANGHVTGKLETKDMLRGFYASFPLKSNLENVLNGIAYDSSSKKMYITGKLWPKLFELKLN